MNHHFSLRILFTAFLILGGCGSWQLKEHCEKTNWFEYSRDVALNGRYLEEDALIKDCKKVSRTNATLLDQGFKSGRERYCTYENFLRRGEAGDLVNFKMCDGLIMYQMQERYGQGLQKFCTPEVGYNYGASGQVYKNVCFKKTESVFLNPYFKGRREYLEKTIVRLEVDTKTINSALASLSRQIDILSLEIQALPSPQECRQLQVYNEATKANEFRLICSESAYIQSRRSGLYSQMNLLRGQYSRSSDVLSDLMKQLIFNRSELTKIPLNN